MQIKPSYPVIAIIILSPLLILLIDILLILSLGMKTTGEYKIDKILHFLGGTSIYLFSVGVFWHLEKRKLIELQDVKLFPVLMFGILCFVIIMWELLEYLAYFYIPIFPGYSHYLTYSDTITDMLIGLAGGLCAMLFTLKPIKQSNK